MVMKVVSMMKKSERTQEWPALTLLCRGRPKGVESNNSVRTSGGGVEEIPAVQVSAGSVLK